MQSVECRVWSRFWSATGCSSLSDTLQYIYFWFSYLYWRQLALFADDSALFSTHAKADVIIDRLQSALNTIKKYFSTWRIKLNPLKTQAVYFTKRRTRELPTSDLSLDGCYIPWSDRAKYLGLVLDKKLTFPPHFDYVSEKVQ
jgi:hypothetical protein